MTATTNQQIPTPAKRDIEELSHKIDQFQTGKMHEERFRHYRLTRGVYGQRQADQIDDQAYRHGKAVGCQRETEMGTDGIMLENRFAGAYAQTG